jgi:Asp-tRNA(Asn)/Glu-tRNA(Gln) amidotransferase B subunit
MYNCITDWLCKYDLRCGTGLMEIVFEPDLFDGEEAAALIKELALILQVMDN